MTTMIVRPARMGRSYNRICRCCASCPSVGAPGGWQDIYQRFFLLAKPASGLGNRSQVGEPLTYRLPPLTESA